MGRSRPNSADKETARVFGVGVRQTLFTSWVVPRAALARGRKNSSYQEYQPRPQVSFALKPRSCEVCRVCVHSCPVAAFAGGDPKSIDLSRCIVCAACIKLCPHKARTFADDDFLDEVALMAANNTEAKRPSTFLPSNLPEYMG